MNCIPMSTTIDPSVISLGQALINLIGRGDIPHGRIDRVKSAIAKAGRLLGRSPDELPAHLPYIMRHLNRMKPGPGEKGRKTLANTKSELRFLIRTVTGKGQKSEFAPLSPAWAALRAHVSDQPVLWKLSRFMAFCSTTGVLPEKVDDGVAQAFRRDLISSQDSDKPEQHIRAAIRAWNRCISEYQGWPQRPLHLEPPRKHRWTFEESRFCESFQRDVSQWLDRLGRSDRLGEDGPRRALRPTTIKHRRHQIYKAASALVMSGLSIGDLTSLAVLVEPDHFKSALQYLLDKQDGNPSEALFGLSNALRAVATHQVKAAQPQLDTLRRIAAGLEPEESGLGVRTEQRLEPFEDERVLAALLRLPKALVSEAETLSIKARKNNKKTIARFAAVMAQIAIAIEIETFAPLRLRNLTRLNLNQHIKAVQIDRKTHWIIKVPRTETKNRAALTYFLSPKSVTLIKRAMHLYDQKSGWLFPGRGDSHKCEKALSDQIKRCVERRLNVRFNVHLFRALGATLHLKENPNGFESAMVFVGDRDAKTVRQSYTHVADRHLIASAQNTILKTRSRLSGVGG